MGWKTRKRGSPRQVGAKFRTSNGRREYYDPEMKVWKQSAFFTAKYKYLGKAISLRTSSEARDSVNWLRKEYITSVRRDKKLRLLRATRLAAARSGIMSRNKKLSHDVREEKSLIEKIYYNMYLVLRRMYVRKYYGRE